MEASKSSGENRMTRGRKKQEEMQREMEEKARKEAKRRKTLFQPRKVVGSRDILVNRTLRKIHVGGAEEDIKPVVKLEETGGDQQQGEGDDIGVRSHEGSVDMQVMEVEHVVKVEAVEMDINAGNESLVLEGSVDPIQLLKQENDSIKAKNVELEGKVKELEARVTQLENRDKEELEALVDRKLREHGINLQPGSQNLQEEVPMTSGEPETTSNVYLVGADVPAVMAQLDVDNTKVTKLFPEVAEIFWKKYGKTLLSSNDFLNARLVCASWNQGIDKIPKGPCQVLHQKRLITVPVCCLEHTSEFVKDRESIGLLPQTRLEFSIKDSCDEIQRLPEILLNEAWTECKTKLTRLLQKYGSNIQKVYLFPTWCSAIASRDSLGWYSTVVELLPLMPNLKDFSLLGAYTNDAALSNFIDSQPFHKLSNLQHFSFGSFRFPATVLRAMLLSNNHITRMDISLTGIMITGIFQDVSLTQLKELQVTSLMRPQDLKCLIDLSAPSLQVLKLSRASYLDDWESVDCVDSEIVYKLLEPFQATLVDLELNFKHLLLDSLPEMPKLKRFKIRLEYCMYVPDRNIRLCKQLVASMTGLEYLEFTQWRIQKRNLVQLHLVHPPGYALEFTEYDCRGLFSSCFKGKIARRYKFVKTELVSKLWDLLPKLQHVKVSLEHCFTSGSKYSYLDFLRMSK